MSTEDYLKTICIEEAPDTSKCLDELSYLYRGGVFDGAVGIALGLAFLVAIGSLCFAIGTDY